MINIGIIGIGYWGPNYARSLLSIDNVNLKWCCDIDESAIAKFKKNFPYTKTTQNINDLLDDTRLDAAIVVTPAQHHYKIVKQFLEKGKDVLVEKPITTSLSDASELVRLARRKKKILMVDHTFIFNPAVQKMKELIDKNALGKTYYMHGAYNALGPIRRDVSAMWDLPHFIYVANYLLGKEPISIIASGGRYLMKEMEDVVFLTLEYPSGVLFNLYCSWIDPVKIRRLVVVGDKKMAVFDDMLAEERLRIYDKGVNIIGDPNFANLQMIVRSGDVIIPKVEAKEPLKEVVLTFLDAVRTRHLTQSTGTDGMNLVKVLAAAQRSLEMNNKKILIKDITNNGHAK